MKTTLFIALLCLMVSTLCSVIDRTITMDAPLMQSLRDNLNQSTAPDPLIYDYLYSWRNDEEDLLDSSEERVIYFNQNIANFARDAIYLAVKYHTLNTSQLQSVQNLINGICNDPTSNEYVYIKPPGMTSPNQAVSGANPGSIVQLIYNTDNDYSYCDRLPFRTDPNQGFISSDLDNYNRVYYASNGLAFVSFIYDMLYYEMTPTQRALAFENIEILSGYLYNYLQNPTTIGMTPWNNHYSPFWANTNANGSIIWSDGHDKINLVGARSYELLASLGYSRLVLGHMPGNDQILDWVMDMYDSVPIQEDFQGLLEYIFKKSGAYVGGYGYASQALKGTPQIFFTALKRLTGINYWDNPNIKKSVNSVVDNLTPGYFTVPLEDDWWDHYGIDRSLLEYYYQNTDDPVGRNKIKWYLYRLKARYGGSWPSTKPFHIFINFPIVYSYNPSNPVGPDDYQPISSLSGIYSNQEYTHLSPPLLGGQNYETQAYKNRLWLHINHENSYEEENFHTSQEKGHYRLYYDNKQFIIDPGYRASYPDSFNGVAMGGWWRTLHWCRSIYSKNMVVVNPDEENERSYVNEQFSLTSLPSPATVLKLKRPLSGSRWDLYSGNDNLVDDCKREYLLTNKDIRHLKVRINYNDLSPDNLGNVSYSSPADVIDARLVRNFYSLGNDGILVYDKVASLNEQSNTYRNQLHFNPSAVMNYNSTTGVFSATMGSSRLFGTMGALASSSSKRIDGQKVGGTIDDTLFPRGLPTGNESSQINASNIYTRAHSRIRVDTVSSTGSSFLTLLIPSSSGTNPITSVVESSNAYLAYANIDPSNQVYTGVSNQSQSMINGLRFTTDADLFYTRANNDFSNIKSMIINNGNALTIRDYSETGFGEIELFQGYASGIEEYISEWSNNQLVMTISSAQSQYPRFKIIRNGISPDNFSAKLLFSINWDETAVIVTDEPISRGCIPNVIQSLAYDASYFYVNYTWEELENDGLICDGLVIAKGNVPETILTANIAFNGQINLEGNVTVALTRSLTILPNSQISFAGDYGIYNHGSLIIDGGASKSITLGNSDQQWNGITTYRDGDLVCSQATIDNATIGIQIRGAATIDDNEVRNCGQGLSIETATPFTVVGNLIKSNTYGIMISNNYSSSNMGYIEGNEVTQNGLGIVLYNSNTKIAQNDIHANTRGGLYLLRGSDPIVKDNNISFSENTISTRPEITLESDSYPIIDDTRNDINSDGLGYSLYYVNAESGRIKQLIARNNYWGSTNAHQIRNSIYPPMWDVVFEPFSIEPNTFFPHLGDNLFKQALAVEESGDIALAKQLYSAIIATEPDSLYALQSLGRLNSIYSGSPSLLSELRSIYSIYTAVCSDSILIKSAQIKNVMIDRFDGMYQQAIQGYEDQMHLSTTELDSLLCLLDIAYTLQDMYYDDQGKGTYAGMPYMSNGISITSLKDAKQTVDQLLGEIFAKSDISTIDNAPVPAKLDVMNYPNPFNPSTTIAFSLPEEGSVRMTIYNIRGQRVRELINGRLTRGFHKVVWDGKDNGNRNVSSGLYFVRIETGKTSTVRKIMMLK